MTRSGNEKHGAQKKQKRRNKRPSGERGDFAWIQRELERQGKTQSDLARYLGHGDASRISKIVHGKYWLRATELEAVRTFLGVSGYANGPEGQQVSDQHDIPVVGVAAEGVYLDPMRSRNLKGLRRQTVPSPETAKWGPRRYAIELDEPIDKHANIEAEWAICAPIAAIKRPLAPYDLVHMEHSVGRLKETAICLVRRSRSGSLEFVSTTGKGELLKDQREVVGLVVGRNMVLK